LNLSKCSWFLLSWVWKNGKAKLARADKCPGTLKLTAGSDIHNPVNIQRIEPTDSFRTLGVHISPSGSNTGAKDILLKISLDYATQIVSSTFTREDALWSYILYFLLKIRFQLPILSLSKMECLAIQVPALRAFLPKIHINRNTARSIIFGPEELGGLALPILNRESLNSNYSWAICDFKIKLVNLYKLI
jgi:hypothetical protein